MSPDQNYTHLLWYKRVDINNVTLEMLANFVLPFLCSIVKLHFWLILAILINHRLDKLNQRPNFCTHPNIYTQCCGPNFYESHVRERCVAFNKYLMRAVGCRKLLLRPFDNLIYDSESECGEVENCHSKVKFSLVGVLHTFTSRRSAATGRLQLKLCFTPPRSDELLNPF